MTTSIDLSNSFNIKYSHQYKKSQRILLLKYLLIVFVIFSICLLLAGLSFILKEKIGIFASAIPGFFAVSLFISILFAFFLILPNLCLSFLPISLYLVKSGNWCGPHVELIRNFRNLQIYREKSRYLIKGQDEKGNNIEFDVQYSDISEDDFKYLDLFFLNSNIKIEDLLSVQIENEYPNRNKNIFTLAKELMSFGFSILMIVPLMIVGPVLSFLVILVKWATMLFTGVFVGGVVIIVPLVVLTLVVLIVKWLWYL